MSCRYLDTGQVSFDSRERLRKWLAYALAGKGVWEGKWEERGIRGSWRRERNEGVLNNQKAVVSTKREMRQ